MSESTRDYIRTDTNELIDEPIEVMRANPLQIVHRQLRGRYRVTILLTVLLGLCGGLVGYVLITPRYESVGLVQIAPTLPAVLYESEENRIPPLFDSFLTTQAALLRSTELLEDALANGGLVEAGWESGPQGVAQLQNALEVRRKRLEQVISIRVTHREPWLAQTAVNALLSTYIQREDDRSGMTNSAREVQLMERQEQLEGELDGLRAQTLVASDHLGATAIQRLHTVKLHELEVLDQNLADLAFAASVLELPNGAESSAKILASLNIPMTDVRIDEQLENLQKQEAELTGQLASLSRKLKPKHPAMIERLRELDAVRVQIRRREAEIADEVGQTADAAVIAAGTPADRIRHATTIYQSLRDQVNAEAAHLGRQRSELSELHAQSEDVKKRLDETRTRLDQLQVERGLEKKARISILALGTLPLAPASDKRAGTTFIGTMFGGGLAVGLVVLFGLARGLCRFAEDLEVLQDEAPVIGVVPDIGGESSDAKAQAGIVVHQLCSALNLTSNADRHPVYAVTSPSCGDGKTSIALAMGASFAAAGLKTLVADVDLVAQGLTRHLKLQSKNGLCQALGMVEGPGQVHRTTTVNLWMMPTGRSKTMPPQQLSPSKLNSLIDTLRDRFEVIVLDTGPILESLEAPVAVGAADRTVVVTSTGSKMGDIRAALARLVEIDAYCQGLVLNRAVAADCRYAAALNARTNEWAEHLSLRTTTQRMSSVSAASNEDDQQSSEPSDQDGEPRLRLTKPPIEEMPDESMKDDEKMQDDENRRRAA